MLDRLHYLLEAIAGRVAYVTDATERGDHRRGGVRSGAGGLPGPCAHLHRRCPAAGVPARYVTGYLHVEDEDARGR